MRDALENLYDRLGGQNAVLKLVPRLGQKMQNDPLLHPLYQSTDQKSIDHCLRAILMIAFDGPHHFTNLDLRASHFDMHIAGLHQRHFDASVRHLETVMQELDMAETDIAEATANLEKTRRAVLNM